MRVEVWHEVRDAVCDGIWRGETQAFVFCLIWVQCSRFVVLRHGRRWRQSMTTSKARCQINNLANLKDAPAWNYRFTHWIAREHRRREARCSSKDWSCCPMHRCETKYENKCETQYETVYDEVCESAQPQALVIPIMPHNTDDNPDDKWWQSRL